MLAGLLLLSAVNPTVDVQTGVIPLSRLLSVASPAGVRLECDDVIGADLVAVRAKVPLDAFMARVAEATLGTWKPVEGGQRLVRDDTKWQAAEKAETEVRMRLMREAIGRLTEPTTKHPQFTAETARALGAAMREAAAKLSTNADTLTIDWNSLHGRSPADRLLARLLLLLDPADLVTMREGERRVWSTRPNRLQRAIGSGAANALGLFIEESKVWQANRPANLESDGLSVLGMHPNWSGTKGTPTRALLIANSWGSHGFMNLELKLLDDRGRELTTAGTAFSPGHPMISKEDKAPEALPGERRMEWSKETLIVQGLKARTAHEIPADMRKLYLAPEERDPYLQAGVEIAQLLAEERPFIVVANDLLAQVFDSVMQNSPASTVRWTLDRFGHVELADREGWFVITPRHRVLGRAMTLNRMALGPMLRDMEQRGGPSLDHLLTLSRSSECHSPVLTAWLRALYPETGSHMTLTSWDVLRFYDALRPSLGSAEEQMIPIGQLNEQAKNRLTTLEFFSVYGQSLSTAMSMEDEPDPELPMTLEPTERWPNGLPAELQLKVDRPKGVVLAGIGSAYDPVEPAELGTQLAMQERPDVFPWVADIPLPARFAVLSMSGVAMSLMVRVNEWLSSYRLLDFTRTDRRTYTVGELPPDIFKKVEEARAESRKAYSNINTSGRGGGNIPPLNTP